ncbi:hypothetical protein M5689_018943 [Euphorbia peplus]|nr:hypothetical protein M5689_018943 [Euphorbia peplus]
MDACDDPDFVISANTPADEKERSDADGYGDDDNNRMVAIVPKRPVPRQLKKEKVGVLKFVKKSGKKRLLFQSLGMSVVCVKEVRMLL